MNVVNQKVQTLYYRHNCCQQEETAVTIPVIITGEKHPCVDLLKNSLGGISRETKFDNPQHPVDETICSRPGVHFKKVSSL